MWRESALGALRANWEEKLPWTKLTTTLLPHSGVFDIQLAEEPLGWKMGDKLVIASTDYNKEQAEVVEVVGMPSLPSPTLLQLLRRW